MDELPSGTVTFMFTDIEGSTRLLQQLGAARYGSALSVQRTLVRAVFKRHDGCEVDTQGDAFFVSFPRAAGAVAAAVEIQQALAACDWPEGVDIRVRMGLHTGEPHQAETGYVGIDVHRAARIAHIGHGGQVLLSETTTALVQDDLPTGIGLLDLGKHRLKDMPREEQIHQLLISGLQADFPTLRSLSAYPNNLPVQTTPFIGREFELVELLKLLADPSIRLVTVLGPGGTGKTRLALAAAEVQQQNAPGTVDLVNRPFPDGLFFVPLAALEAEEGIIFAIGEAVGYKFFQGMEYRDQLKRYLQNKSLLLILDNFEHLLPGASLIPDLLADTAGLKIIITSRQKLNLRGEAIFRLDGMHLPPEESMQDVDPVVQENFDAVEMFLQGARRVNPSFAPTIEDHKWIYEICRQVDGLPLGIELAAAWAEMLSPQEIALEIQESYDFLAVDHRDAPARQQSLRAVFDYSWNLLPVDEREIFAGLSVFRGFDRAAARAVAGADLPVLMRLVDKSLLQRDLLTGRYQIHPILLSFAEEILLDSGRDPAVREAHAGYFSEFMDRRNDRVYGDRQLETLQEIELDFQNVKRAWHWAIEQKKDDIIDPIIDPMYVFCEWLNRYQEGEKFFGRARENLAPAQGEVPSATWARTLLPWYDLRTEGRGPLSASEKSRIQTQAKISLEAARRNGDPAWLASSHALLGAVAEDNHDLEPAIFNYEQALDYREEIGDRYWIRIRLGLCYRKAGLLEDALAAFRSSLERGRAINDLVKISWSLFNIGETSLLTDDTAGDDELELAEACWREANAGFRQINVASGLIWTNTDLSLVAFIKEDFREVKVLAGESLDLARDFSPRAYGKREAYGMLASVEALRGEFVSARQFLQAWLSTDPDLEIACRSSAVGRPVMLLLTLPAAALVLAEDGVLDLAVKLVALASDHPANPFDLKRRWPSLDEKISGWEAELGPEAFASAWECGHRSDFNELVGVLMEAMAPAGENRSANDR